MKSLSVALALFFSAFTVTLGDVRPVDSNAPVLQYFAPVQIAPRPGHTDAPNFTFDKQKPLLTITSVRQSLSKRLVQGFEEGSKRPAFYPIVFSLTLQMP